VQINNATLDDNDKSSIGAEVAEIAKEIGSIISDTQFNGQTVFPYTPCGYTPAQIQGAYGVASSIASGIDGRGQTVAIIDAFAGNTIEFIRSESPLLIDGVGIPDIDVDMHRRHVVIVAEGPNAGDDLRALKPFIKEYQPVLVGVGAGADLLRKQGYRPQLIVGNPATITTETLRCGAQVVLPADADGHAVGLERIQDLGVGAMTFPAAGSAADLALLLCDHHGASLIVTAGHAASIEEFFDRSRQQSNPSTFLTRLKVGEKLVDAKAVATLYRSRVSGGAIAMLVLAMLVAVIVALWVSRADAAVLDWVVGYWHRFMVWVQDLIT